MTDSTKKLQYGPVNVTELDVSHVRQSDTVTDVNAVDVDIRIYVEDSDEPVIVGEVTLWHLSDGSYGVDPDTPLEYWASPGLVHCCDRDLILAIRDAASTAAEERERDAS